MSKLSESSRKSRNEYYREWRKKNPDKVLAIQERYWEKKRREVELQQEEGVRDGPEAE